MATKYLDYTGLGQYDTKIKEYISGSYVKYSASQSLTDAQKSQARTNIGAGTSNLALGSTSSTASAGNHLYHYWTNNQYYSDSYSGEKNWRMMTENVLADTLRFKAGTIANKEYYNYTNSTWTTWDKDLSNLFDGMSGTNTTIPYAQRKFRFTITSSSGWPTTTMLCLEGSWYDAGTISKVGSTNAYVVVTIETRASANDSWATKVTANFPNNCMNKNALCVPSSALHTGHTLYRITVELGSWTNTNNTASLRRLMILSNYGGNALSPFTYNGSGKVTAMNTLNATTLQEGGTNLSSKYLGISAKAADSSKLNGQEASYYLNYNNLSNKPTIPTKTSDLTNDSGFITNSSLSSYVPTSRTINGKALSSDITLSASDVSALPSNTSYVSSVNGSSGAITNVAKTNADNNFSTNQTFKDITLYASSGDSPRIIFQRGTLTDTYNDWSFYDSGGYLYIQERGSGSSAWGTRASFTQSGVNFVGTISENSVSLINKYVSFTTSQTLTDTQKSTARTNIGAGTSNFSGDYNDLTNKPTIPTSYVSSVNGSTGAITNVAKTDSANTFTTAQTINSSSGNTCLTLKSAGSAAGYISYRNSSNTYLGAIGVLKSSTTGNVARPVFDDGTIHQLAYKNEISSGTVLFKHELTDESTGNVWVIITDDETPIEYDSMKLYWRFYGTYISAMVCWYDGDGYRWYNAELQASDSYAPYSSAPSEIVYFSNLKILGRNTYVYIDEENFGEIITEL